ncbi:GNAT family N-acetyltransferase [Dyadobacter fermentans]|uniref:GNAT family N-acetyltransferase n=1 Tax=Dyadobacter fermentans TaxID=94254 RepID=UPI00059FC404|nr:GNAT family N-acetyltransferase [Dyadobacter fermentans]
MLPKPILLSRAQIDAQAWDNHIHHSRQCVIYALSWYLDVVCEQWQALIWPSAADFSIVMPLPMRRKFGRRVLYQPLFCQYLGLFSKDELSTRQCSAFLEALKTHFSYISSYAFSPEDYALYDKIRDKDVDWEVFQTHWLRLDHSYDLLFSGYSKDRRTNVKRGRKAIWEIIESDDFGPLIDLFNKNHAQRIGKIEPGAYQTLRLLGTKCIQNGNGRLMYALAGRRVHAGILLVHFRGRTIYIFNAADENGRRGNARAVMLDNYIRENAGKEQVFDFESPPNQSIAGYYAGFGAEEIPFFSIRRNALPFQLRQIQEFRKWLIIKTRRYLSSSLYTTLNPFPKTRF